MIAADDFHVAGLIRTAASAEERARILLRVPDGILWRKASELIRACFEAQFALGMHFVEVKVAAMCAMREPDGRLPAGVLDQVEMYRGLLVRLAEV